MKLKKNSEGVFAAINNFNSLLDEREVAFNSKIVGIGPLITSVLNANIYGCFIILHSQV